MGKPGKKIFFVAVGVILVNVSAYLIAGSVEPVQASVKRGIYPQAAQLTVSPISQASASFASQSTPTSTSQSKPVVEWIKQHQALAVGIGVSSIFAVFYLGVLWFRPTWLLVMPSEFHIPKTSIKLTPGIVRFLKYRPRVLDAWVADRISQVQKEFEQRPTVKDRNVYIPIPIELNNSKSAITNFSANDLKPVFAKRSIRLLIWGEGGVGKTSLACQIAKWVMEEGESERLCKHRMLPVLLEEELGEGEGQSPLLEAIARQIKNLRDDEKPVSEELLKQLLEKRRILVIVDHLSEMSEATRKAIRLRDASFPVNALVVTSRLEGILGTETTQTTLRPLRVSGKQLSIFMDAYLTQRGNRDLFDDAEYFDALRRLSQIVTDDRNITVLFAKLYADQMIAIAEGLVAEDLPDNVPDLMLSYVNKLNRNELEDRLEDEIVQRDAKVIAWECLKHTFKPGIAEREQIISSLAILENDSETAKENAKKRLKYLENCLFLIRTVPPAKTQIRLTLDPLAEYLAGLHLVQIYGENEQAWQAFLDEAKDKSDNLDEIKGFFLAVRDCCIARVGETKVPACVAKELGKLAGLDLKVLEQERLRQRIQRLINNLSLPDAEDRARAAEALGKIGQPASNALFPLIKSLRDDDLEVRSNVAVAIGNIGKATDLVLQELILLLVDKSKYVRRAAVVALGDLDNSSELVINALLSLIKDTDSSVRANIALVLGKLGNSSELVLQGLVELLEDEDKRVKSQAIQALNDLKKPSGIVFNGLLKLMKAINEYDPVELIIRSSAVKTIGDLGNAPEFVVNTLVEFLNTSLPSSISGIQSDAAQALGKLCNTSENVLRILLDLLKSENANLRAGAASALGNSSNSPESVRERLRVLLKDEDGYVRLSVIIALGNLVDASENTLQELLGFLQNKDEGFRWAAATALGMIGIQEKEVINQLEKACKDEDLYVEQAAKKALERIKNSNNT